MTIGIAWYRPQDWNRLLEISTDREKLEDSHGEWLREVNRVIREFERKGLRVRKVIVDLDELANWCQENNLTCNGEARARFVSEKVHQEESGSRPAD